MPAPWRPYIVNRPRNGCISWCVFCKKLLWSGSPNVSFHCFRAQEFSRAPGWVKPYAMPSWAGHAYAHKSCHHAWNMSYLIPEGRKKGTFPQPYPTHFPRQYKIAVFFDVILPKVMAMKRKRRKLKT